MVDSMSSDDRLVLPRAATNPRARRFPFNLIQLLANNLEVIPEEAYRKPVTVIPGPPRMAFFTGPEIVNTLLLSNHQSFPKGRLQNEVLEPMFGNAMISSEGHDWRWQRAVAAPPFRHSELMQYGSVMTEAAEATVSTWRASESSTSRPIHKDMLRASFHVIANTMLADGATNVISAIEKGHAAYFSGANWWIVYRMLGLPHWFPRPGGAGMRGHERRLRHSVGERIRQLRDTAGDQDTLLARMAQATDPDSGKSMSDELLVDNIVSFLVAGYDTTALALTWTLYLLSQSPEWEQRILDEVARIAPSGPITSDHFSKLVSVQQVVKESLRLFPTAPIIVRDIIEDTDIDGVSIPAGTIGIIPIYAIHRHHDLWDEPDRFNPERFSPDAKTRPSRFQYMPFGAGPRICIGAAFALIEATIMIATFVRAARFEIEPGFDPRPTGQMFLLPKNGMEMRVMLRDGRH